MTIIIIIGDTYARCTICAFDFTIHHGGRNDVTHHLKTKRHTEMSKAVSNVRSINAHHKPQVTDDVIAAETRWATFVAKHNLAFLSSDHATRLFKVMFPDSEIAN